MQQNVGLCPINYCSYDYSGSYQRINKFVEVDKSVYRPSVEYHVAKPRLRAPCKEVERLWIKSLKRAAQLEMQLTALKSTLLWL